MATPHSTPSAYSLRPIVSLSRLQEVLTYHPESGVFVRNFTTSANALKGMEAGSYDKYGYKNINLDGRMYKSHRLAWFYYYGEWPSDMVDHINGVKDDNRIKNLRIANKSQNAQNVKSAKATTGLDLLERNGIRRKENGHRAYRFAKR